MKVPPPPPGYDKDRTLTRRTVKGAAGGMEGVDYTLTPTPGAEPVKASVGAGANRDDKDRDRSKAGAPKSLGKKASEALLPPGGMVRDEQELILEDEDATTRETKNKQNARLSVARDRMTIDKDAPQLVRKNKYDRPEEDEEDTREEEELDLPSIGEAILGSDEPYRPSPKRRSRIGDPALTDPEAMMSALGTPNAYARHALILAEAFQSAGAYRHEAIEYLASIFVGLRDRTFARNALKELGIGTGVVDLYPLEVVDHLLSHFPGFLPKSGYGRLFRPGRGKTETLHLRPGVPRLFYYSADLRVRGFALVGGGRPGYTFEPGPDPGRYSLRIDRPGEYQLLVSALTKSGHTIVDRLKVMVRGAKKERYDATTLVPRDEERLRAWPRPTPRPIEAHELLEEEDAATALSGGEITRRQQLDALRGPKGDEPDQEPEKADPKLQAPPSDDEELSHAEASMLWLALATHSRASDVNPAKKDEEDS